jgi:hypothetical protein
MVYLVNISNLNRYPMGSPPLFAPDEFVAPPLGSQWIATVDEADSYTINHGLIINTDSNGSFFSQEIYNAEFDFWCKITLDGLNPQWNDYGNIFIASENSTSWYTDFYFQRNVDEENSLAYYIGIDGGNIASGDPYDPGINQSIPYMYLRIKYTLGDKIRIYWSQGSEWKEITYVGSVIPSTPKKITWVSAASWNGGDPHEVIFSYVRDHNLIPLEPVIVPDEFAAPPIGGQWVIYIGGTNTYEIVPGKGLVFTINDASNSNLSQANIEETEFDIWCKISIESTGDIHSISYGGLEFQFGSPGDENYYYAAIYYQYYIDLNPKYSFAIFIDTGDTVFIDEDPIADPGIDQNIPYAYVRIKYSIEDKIRIYWTQGVSDWIEFEYVGNAIVPATIGDMWLTMGALDSTSHEGAFEFVRDHNLIPYT